MRKKITSKAPWWLALTLALPVCALALFSCDSEGGKQPDKNEPHNNQPAEDEDEETDDGDETVFAVSEDGAFSVTKGGKVGLADKKKLTQNARIPGEIGGVKTKTIDDGAFWNCETVKTVIIPDSVTRIGDHAFENCPSLESVTLGKYIKRIGSEAFYGCVALESLSFGGASAQWDQLDKGSNWKGIADSSLIRATKVSCADGDYQFVVKSEDDLFEADENSLRISEDSKTAVSGAITIPSSISGHAIKQISGDGFRECASVTSITIPDSVISIGMRAFSKCSGLTGITIPNSVKSIETQAFANCSSLESISIPSSITEISNFAFSNCSALTSVNLNDAITSIASYAFSECRALETISIPNSVSVIGKCAFSECSGLKSIALPDKLGKISDSMFFSCPSLSSVTVPDSVTSIGEKAFYGCENLTSIRFAGSKAQWAGIEKNEDWNLGIPAATRVLCSDGMADM